MIDKATVDLLLAEYWSRECFCARLPDQWLATLREELDDFEPTRLIARHKGEASVWFEDRDNRQQIVDMPPDKALAFYQAGMTVFLADFETPSLRDWRVDLSRRLRLHPEGYITGLFLTGKHNVTACHFDHIENFTLQLRGSKHWRTARNMHVDLPSVNYSVKSVRAHHEEMWRYAQRPLPSEMPAGAKNLDVHPGSLIYVPRGFWHEVESTDESVSFCLGFPARMWLDLFLPALRTALLAISSWRGNVVYPDATPSARERARTFLSEMLFEMRKSIEDLDVDWLLPPPAKEIVTSSSSLAQAMFRRNPFCTLGIYSESPSTMELRATTDIGYFSRVRTASVPREWTPVVEHVLRESCVTVQSLQALHVQLATEVPRITTVLEELDLLRQETTT